MKSHVLLIFFFPLLYQISYVHRVGRTARAGRAGRSVTLIGEQRRLVMKEVLRGMEEEQRAGIQTRAVAPKVVAHFKEKVKNLKKDVEELLKEEADLKEVPCVRNNNPCMF
jgi:ATP-dependent RNA helicase DDX27